jgi:hypothetical protein
VVGRETHRVIARPSPEIARVTFVPMGLEPGAAKEAARNEVPQKPRQARKGFLLVGVWSRATEALVDVSDVRLDKKTKRLDGMKRERVAMVPPMVELKHRDRCRDPRDLTPSGVSRGPSSSGSQQGGWERAEQALKSRLRKSGFTDYVRGLGRTSSGQEPKDGQQVVVHGSFPG